MKHRLGLGAAAGFAGLILSLGGTVSAQCMQWDASVAFPTHMQRVTEFGTYDLGAGQMLLVARDSGYYSIDQWRSSAWWSIGGFDDPTYALCTYDDGTGAALYAGGEFNYNSFGTLMVKLAKYDGQHWVAVHLPTILQSNGVRSLCVHDDGSGPKLYAGGGFPSYPPQNSPSLVAWDGTNWSGVGGGITAPISPSPQGWVYALHSFDDGSGPALFVGGYFAAIGGIPTYGLAKWNGSSWTTFGAGLTYQGNPGYALCFITYDDGTGPALYMGGGFDHIGAVQVSGIARWNGTTWAPIPGLVAGARDMVIHDDGTGPALYLAGGALIGTDWAYGAVRWDGHHATSLGGGSLLKIQGVASFDDGNGRGPALFAAGDGSASLGGFGGNLNTQIARWYGNCQSPIDTLCFGDGTFAPCPCSNYGANGRGCANSAATQGAQLSHAGSPSPDTLVLGTTSAPAGSLSVFLQGSSLRPMQVSFGDGILCLGPGLLRLYAKDAPGGMARAPGPGEPSITQRSAALGDALAPGTVRYYQVWYRDALASFCTAGGTSNLTNGLRVVW